MKRYEMIKDKERFSYIIKKGRFAKNKHFVIYKVINTSNQTKFGIAIKHTIGSAVVRNRLKRQTRAIIDNNKKMFKNDSDYIIMIREGLLSSKFSDMNNSFTELMERINK